MVMIRVAAVCTFVVGMAVLISGAGAQTRAAGTLAGVVTRGADGQAAPGARIIVAKVSGVTTTDENGAFSIANIPAGTYEVFARREHLAAPRQRVTVVNGETVRVTFVLSENVVNEEITVTAGVIGTATAFDSFNSISSLDSVKLAEQRGVSIADVLASVPGVATRSFGPSITRPIIRGFDGDRVLIMEDGMRTGDLSSTSADHSVSIDPAGLDRLEVVKGPATLLYGSNAIGGVVNALTLQDTFRSSPVRGMLANITADAGTTDGQAGSSANAVFGRGTWIAWAGGGSRRTHDYSAPAGPIENSETSRQSAKGGLGWAGTRGFASFGGQIERNRFQIPLAEGDVFVQNRGTRNTFRVDAGLRNLSGPFADTVKVTVVGTDYTQDETENEDGVVVLGTRFENDTASLRAEIEQKQTTRLRGRLGLEWLNRDFKASGEEALSPETRQGAFSAFAYEEVHLGTANIQFGARLERTAYAPGERPERHQDEGDEDGHDAGDVDLEPIEPPPADPRDFTAFSGSLGAHIPLGAATAFVANLTSSSRAPALEELYNFGPDAGNGAFEVGDPRLRIERALGVDVSLRGRAPRASVELNAFVYRIANFVFLNFTGADVGSVREAMYMQGDARVTGWEAAGHADLREGVRIRGGVSAVRATLTDTDESLPRIPPVAAHAELELSFGRLTLNPGVIVTTEQRDVFRDERPTDGWATFGFGASYVVIRSRATHAITLRAFNLTNTEYRLHTSFIKELAPEIGRGARVTYTVNFF
jgi:iron complex outermembrane receptor protein